VSGTNSSRFRQWLSNKKALVGAIGLTLPIGGVLFAAGQARGHDTEQIATNRSAIESLQDSKADGTTVRVMFDDLQSRLGRIEAQQSRIIDILIGGN
jgi:hypothetical protein